MRTTGIDHGGYNGYMCPLTFKLEGFLLLNNLLRLLIFSLKEAKKHIMTSKKGYQVYKRLHTSNFLLVVSPTFETNRCQCSSLGTNATCVSIYYFIIFERTAATLFELSGKLCLVSVPLAITKL